MRIHNYKYSDGYSGGWDYSPIEFNKVNLLVGESGSGKTKFLNTIYNIGSIITSSAQTRGSWQFKFEISGKLYAWIYHNPSGHSIEKEQVIEFATDGEKLIIDRSPNNFIFQGSKLPKLSSQISAISILQEEDSIKPLYDGFGKISRRNFFSDDLDRSVSISSIPPDVYQQLKTKKDISLLHSKTPLSARLQMMKEFFRDEFDIVCAYYKSIFKKIESIDFVNLETAHPDLNVKINEKVLVFAIKEKNVRNWIGVSDLSSGMQKVLLLLTDIISLPGDWVYLIDEYENSLGVNAINFLPDFLLEHGKNNQFIITTHHPYLINNMPLKNWYLFSRKGSIVDIMHGDGLEKRLGKSNQQAFLKLINDPLYSGE